MLSVTLLINGKAGVLASFWPQMLSLLVPVILLIGNAFRDALKGWVSKTTTMWDFVKQMFNYHWLNKQLNTEVEHKGFGTTWPEFQCQHRHLLHHLASRRLYCLISYDKDKIAVSEGHCENQIKYFQEKVFCIKHFANVSYLNAVMIQGGSPQRGCFWFWRPTIFKCRLLITPI